jgi:hypothetical protein
MLTRTQLVGCWLRDMSFENPKAQLKAVMVDGVERQKRDNTWRLNKIWDTYTPVTKQTISNVDYASLSSLPIAHNDSVASLLIRVRRSMLLKKTHDDEAEQAASQRRLRPRARPSSPAPTSPTPTTPAARPVAPSHQDGDDRGRRVCHFAHCDCRDSTCPNGPAFRKLPRLSSTLVDIAWCFELQY